MNGPGAGPGCGGGNGAGHGGVGGNNGANGCTGGVGYDSVTNPVQQGSGGDNWGGTGEAAAAASSAS